MAGRAPFVVDGTVLVRAPNSCNDLPGTAHTRAITARLSTQRAYTHARTSHMRRSVVQSTRPTNTSTFC